MGLQISIGNQGFDNIIENQSFYIDKTNFIKEWWDSRDVVTLITRPRRFGNTLNMSMLNCFFSNQYANRGDLFEGHSVWEDERYRRIQGTYPVIFLSFADVKQSSYGDAAAKIKNIIVDTYAQYEKLYEDNGMTDMQKHQFRSVNSGMSDVTAQDSLKNLAAHLSRYYGKKVIILLDEYDAPMQELSDIRPGEQREWDREYIHQKTGEERWFRVSVFCSDIQGEKKYILDLSDRTKDKKINQELEEAVYTAENANRAKTTFLNNMSHDIRTPMNAIIGFTNIALKQEMKPEVRNCLVKISDSSEHLLTLINDVLDISRIESGKTRFNPAPVDITTVADVVVDITHGFLTNRAINFDVRRVEPENPYVLADAVRIREVLVNILGNAVKFTDDGGSIAFESTYRPGENNRHIMARYRVTDTGVGMSEDFVEHIFDEFSQEESSARTHYKGTGLGMAITKRYVELMNGTISVESRKGEGSTFIVEFPLELTDESRVQKQDASPTTGVNMKGIKVLLAEDNDLNAEIAMVQLEELGMKVTRASNGKEAVEIFRDSCADTFDFEIVKRRV